MLKSQNGTKTLQPEILDLAVQSAVSSIIVTDHTQPDNPIVYCNAAFERLTGYDAEDIYGRNCRFLQGEDTDAAAVQALRDAIKKGSSCQVTLLNYRKDNTPFWNELFIAPLKMTDGRITHFIGIQHNVTEKKRAEDALEKQQRFTQAALDALKGHIAVLDAQGNIVAVNASWRAFGDANSLSDPRHCLGFNYLDICDQTQGKEAEDARLMAQGIRDVITNKIAEYSLEYPCHSPDGKKKQWFVVRVTRFQNGDEIRIVVSHTNITDRKLVELALKQAYDEMENRVEVRTEELRKTNEKLLDEISERMRIEEALRISEARFKAQYRGIPIPTYTWQKQGDHFVLIDYNHSAEQATSGDVANLVGQTAQQIYGAGRSDVLEDLTYCFSRQKSVRREMADMFKANGNARHLHATYGFVPPDLVMVHAEDVTEQKALEERLRQSQKMEALGMLAGGVAHDFNNILTVINGYSKLAMQNLTPDLSEYAMLDEVNKAGERAALLTHQLLAFSRKQIRRPEILDLNDVIARTEKMLRRLIPANVEFEILLEENLRSVKADVGQFEQVLMNLVVNAKDAMPQGGQLTVETRNVMLSDADVKPFGDVEPGAYVAVMVRDTGDGMEDDVQRHIFDPFFTTKDFGKGTGLGLSTVHGIMKQNAGMIHFESILGQGTTFFAYFPSIGNLTQTSEIADQETDNAICGVGTILVVEDNFDVRKFIQAALEDTGYDILLASNGQEALQTFHSQKEKIDLLMTDMVLPGMNGSVLAKELSNLKVDLKVLYVTGYSPDDLNSFGINDEGFEFLNKPFSPNDLQNKIHKMMIN